MATATVLTRSSNSHSKAEVIDLTLDDDVITNEPPRKRQRTEQPPTTSHSGHGPASSVLDGFNCTIMPRIDAILKDLPESVAEKQQLRQHARLRLIQDGSTVAAGLATRWQFSREREALISNTIRKILQEIRPRHLLPKPPIQLSDDTNQYSSQVPLSSPNLAHRPVGHVSVGGGRAASNTPVPLPTYAHDQSHRHQPQGFPAASPVPKQTSPVPFPRHILQGMTQRASEARVQKQGPSSPGKAWGGSNGISVQSLQPCSKERLAEPLQESVTMPILNRKASISPANPTTPSTTQLSRRSRSIGVSTTTEAKQMSRSGAISNTPTPKPANSVSIPNLQSVSSRSRQSKVSATPCVTISQKDNNDDVRRPYLCARERREIAACVRNRRSVVPGQLISSTTYHIDLTDDELGCIKSALESLDVNHLTLATIKNHPKRVDLAFFLSTKLKGRNVSDMRNFLEDLPELDEKQTRHTLSLARDDFLEQQRRRDRRINALRLSREMNGASGVGAPMSQQSLQTEVLKDLSDSLGHTFAKFGQCSGDVATMVWISERSILCGATSTMDDRTLDHNKQGNLVLYSTSTDKLEVFKDHRELRVRKDGENRDFSREKWLYPSVVASTIDSARSLVYTAAFDKTVKIWKIKGDAASTMGVIGTWPHEGKVNFVAAALNGSGLVATAADVSTKAVRVYAINTQDPDASQYISLSCPRKDDHGNDQWAYWPSTLQWGTARGTEHLLAVGYSPRSRDGDENQIPEDKQRTGAILLWDSCTGRVIPVHANTVANVFEVMWHPNLPQLIVATSKSGLHVEKGVQTQIRIWKQDPDRLATDQGWHEYKTLDCTAEDINELTVMPNSSHHAYITASCTSGEIFVWDTARGDRPIHVLKHGPSIEPFENEEDMKRRDVGVKFTAWGHTPDRLFTGSSDGKVNLWNVRKKRPFIRTVMQGEGAIFCGAFSPDKKILAIGDGPGTVWLLADHDEYPTSWGKVCMKRHIPYVPDTEDTSPTEVVEEDADYPRRRYLDTQQLVHTGNPVVGVVQGPCYADSTHFDLESHLYGNKAGPLVPAVERQQQAALRATQRRRRSLRRLRHIDDHSEQTVQRHIENSGKDFVPELLDPMELRALREERAELEASFEEHFIYEPGFDSDGSEDV